MPIEPPVWLSEPCPAWCGGDHSGQHCPVDRRHESEYVIVPVIQQTTRWRGDARDPLRTVTPTELNVVVFRDVGDDETWVAVANDAQHLEISVESARRLHRALGEALTHVLRGRL